MNCKTHKTYRGIRKPVSTCRRCKFIFAWRKVLKACGCTVAEARRAPKSEATKVGEFCKEFGVAVLEPTKTENFSSGLAAPLVSREYEYDELYVPAPTKDPQDALQVAAIKTGAEKRTETWRTLEVAALLQAHARGELTEHQSTALFLKLTDAGAFHRKEQVRNIGEGAKAE